MGAVSSSQRRIEVLEDLQLRLNEDSDQFSNTQLADSLADAAIMNFVTGGSATYDEMLSTGGLGLIQSQSLRDALARYNRAVLVTNVSGRTTWDASISMVPGFFRAFAISYQISANQGERSFLERELANVISEENILQEVIVFTTSQEFALLGAKISLETAQAVLLELGEVPAH